jgi:hypothetical protein
MPFLFSLNYVAYVVAVVASMAVGMIWYSPKVFGNTWMRLANVHMEEGKKEGMGKIMGLTVLSTLITGYVLSQVLNAFAIGSFAEGMFVTILVWLGFSAAITFMHYLFDGRSLKLFLLYAAHELVSLLVMGAILVGWR